MPTVVVSLVQSRLGEWGLDHRLTERDYTRPGRYTLSIIEALSLSIHDQYTIAAKGDIQLPRQA